MIDDQLHGMVIVPRAVFRKYWSLPWADVLSAAERGEDGLTVGHALLIPWPETRPLENNLSEVRPTRAETYDLFLDHAVIREGDHDKRGWGINKTLLYQQCW